MPMEVLYIAIPWFKNVKRNRGQREQPNLVEEEGSQLKRRLLDSALSYLLILMGT